MLEQNVTTVATSTVAALTHRSEQRSSHDYCMGCDICLTDVDSITLRCVELLEEAVVYALCPQCSLAVCCGGKKRRRIEEHAEQKVLALMALEDAVPAGNA